MPEAGLLRLFIAVPLPEDVRQAVARLQQQLRPGMPPGSWVRAEGLHLTLRFLGDTEPGRVPALGAALEAALAQAPSFALALGTLGAFPPKGRSRVLWLGSADEGGLAHLAEVVEGVVRLQGFAPENRTFHGHLTLCRFRQPGRLTLPEVGDVATFQVDRAVLFQSHLRSQGAEHVPLASFALGGGAP